MQTRPSFRTHIWLTSHQHAGCKFPLHSEITQSQFDLRRENLLGPAATWPYSTRTVRNVDLQSYIKQVHVKPDIKKGDLLQVCWINPISFISGYLTKNSQRFDFGSFSFVVFLPQNAAGAGSVSNPSTTDGPIHSSSTSDHVHMQRMSTSGQAKAQEGDLSRKDKVSLFFQHTSDFSCCLLDISTF